MKLTKVYLNENEMPRYYYNIQADMPNPLHPPLHPGTGQPIGPEDLSVIFPMELIKQEVSKERFIEIPEEVFEVYKTYRSTPIIRAYNLEKVLNTPAKIYYKYEGASPAGSHKLNTALAQAYYNKKEGVEKLCTETGAGQWGTALAYACNFFGLKCRIFMVKVSYNQKPYRKMMMHTYGAEVYASPSELTKSGKEILNKDPHCPGSLGIAISEAVEEAVQDEKTKYALGSVLNHVVLHQTIIGEEAKLQMEKFGDYPDIVIGCHGGGSNFAGLAFPFIKDKLEGKKIRAIAAEPASCPTLTKGIFSYDFGDVSKMTPLLPMYTLGHNFIPPSIHAGGLRYHGASPLVSQLLKDNIIEAQAFTQKEIFSAALLFSKTEGIIPAPESSHAIKCAINEAEKCKEEGTSKTILFNLSGHGLLDMGSYEKYFSNVLEDYDYPEENIKAALKELERYPKIQ
ncbi:MAG TPA: TrpB-like pyridoxal phosphate-dependent enzyme [Bacteroidota bacterium]|nr:TrpB-like pyridoxal phosphate-dependent enzyme [Bacteroidota bacterium]